MLTERRVTFLNRMVEHGDVRLAAEQAGFSQPIYGYEILKEQSVQAELRATLERAKTEDIVFARSVLWKIAGHTDAPAGARVTAARTLLEYAGAMQKVGNGPSGKDPSEMTGDELRALIDRLDRELGDRAKPVEGTESVPLPSQVIDMTA
jgi:hypothetical protein